MSYLWPTLRYCSARRGECLGDHYRYRKRGQRVQDIYILYLGAVKITARCTTTRTISYISEECQPQCRPVHRGQPTHTQRMVKLPKVHPRNVRPTKRSPPRAQNPDAKSRGTRDNAVRLRHEEPARVPLRHAAQSPPQLPDSLHRLVIKQSHRPSDFLSGHVYKDEKLEHRNYYYAQGVDPVRRIHGAHGGYKIAEVCDLQRTGGGRGLRGGAGKRVDGVSSWTISELPVSKSTSRRLQPRTRGNGVRLWNKERNVSWQNGSLQGTSGLDYGMQFYSRT